MLETYAVKLNFDLKLNRPIQEELMQNVDPSKEIRLRRFVREEDRLRGLFGDLLVRDQILQKTSLTNEEIEFGTNEYGKPYLKGVDDFHFNISHSGDWVVAAIDKDPVGIDIEQIQHIDLDISKNYFSDDEHRDLMNQPDRIAYFFTLWSLKESYIKILGKGLSHPLNAFSIQFGSKDDIVIKVGGEILEDVFFTQYEIDENYKMGLCASHQELPKHVNILSMEQLVRRFANNFDARQYWYHGTGSQSISERYTSN
jgi:4'-phosphopantetheinyl transferase